MAPRQHPNVTASAPAGTSSTAYLNFSNTNHNNPFPPWLKAVIIVVVVAVIFFLLFLFVFRKKHARYGSRPATAVANRSNAWARPSSAQHTRHVYQMKR
jgi:phosphotransferase system  glucose/maltose/N-acetylglucosamine-specific IIC component